MVHSAVGSQIGGGVIYGRAIDPIHVYPFLEKRQVLFLQGLLDFPCCIGRSSGPVEKVPASGGTEDEGQDQDSFFTMVLFIDFLLFLYYIEREEKKQGFPLKGKSCEERGYFPVSKRAFCWVNSSMP